MESSSVSPNKLLLLASLLLLFAPVLQLQARELGADSQSQHVAGGFPSVLVLPSGDDDEGAVVDVPPKLNALPDVSRPGGRAPPAPQPGKRPQPGHEPLQDVVVSSLVVTGNQKLAPPSPAGNPPPHYRGLGPAAADLLRVLWDALVRVMWFAA